MSNNILFGTKNQNVGKASPMNGDPHSKLIGRNVARERERAGFSQQELADRIKVKSQNTIAAIELGKTRKSKHLHDIARVLKVSIAALDPSQEPEEATVIPGSSLVGDNDLPIFVSVEAGDGTLIYSSHDPVAMTKRPSPLEGVTGGFGVIVAGESMVPQAHPGDVVLVNPRLQPRQGDLCLFVAERDGEFRATLKQFVSQAKESWTVRRYKPKEKVFTLNKKDWPDCRVVVGIYNRRHLKLR